MYEPQLTDRHSLHGHLRAVANRELLAHARWQIALSRALQQRYLEQASPLLRIAFPYLPLLFGRRASHSDRLRRRPVRLRHRVA
jgi:hypothetical protein